MTAMGSDVHCVRRIPVAVNDVLQRGASIRRCRGLRQRQPGGETVRFDFVPIAGIKPGAGLLIAVRPDHRIDTPGEEVVSELMAAAESLMPFCTDQILPNQADQMQIHGLNVNAAKPSIPRNFAGKFVLDASSLSASLCRASGGQMKFLS